MAVHARAILGDLAVVLGACEHVVEALRDGVAILASIRQVAAGEKADASERGDPDVRLLTVVDGLVVAVQLVADQLVPATLARL